MNKVLYLFLFSILSSCKLTEKSLSLNSHLFGTIKKPNVFFGKETFDFNDRIVKRGIFLLLYDDNRAFYKYMPFNECSGGPSYAGEAKVIGNQIHLSVLNLYRKSIYRTDVEEDSTLYKFSFQIQRNGHLLSSENVDFQKTHVSQRFISYYTTLLE